MEWVSPFALFRGEEKAAIFPYTGQRKRKRLLLLLLLSFYASWERERERRRRSRRRRKWRRIRRIDLSKFIAHTVCSDKLCLKRKKIAVFCNSFVESYTSTPPSFSSLRDKRRGKGEEEKPPPFAVKANAQKRERGLRQKRGKLYVQCSYRVYRWSFKTFPCINICIIFFFRLLFSTRKKIVRNKTCKTVFRFFCFFANEFQGRWSEIDFFFSCAFIFGI